MKPGLVFCGVLIALIQLNCVFGQMAPARLRCEYQVNPLAINTKVPRLSWIIESSDASLRGLRQTAYEILVASSQTALDRDQGDLWASGKVVSNQSIQVEYAGKTLASRHRCCWKVRVWGADGVASAWSKPADWTMGLLAEGDWQGRWLDTGIQTNTLSAMPLFRRNFKLESPIRRALLHVCGLGQYEASLNGRRVGDAAIEPSWSNYRKTCYYRTYEVSSLLKQGSNAVGVMLGNGMYNVPGGRYIKFKGSFGQPKFILQLEVEHENGSRSVIASDDQWKWRPGPVVFSCTFGGEDYDAREEKKDWDTAGYASDGWLSARVSSGPGGQLYPEIVEPIKPLREYSPVKITQPVTNIWVYDLGQNFSGWPVIQVKGARGSKVKLIPGELLDRKGLVSQGSSGGPMWFSYILKGDGIEKWRPRFTFYGFRYVQVEGAIPAGQETGSPDLPQIMSLQGEFLYTAAEKSGEFTCSNEWVNRIHWLINAAILSNFKSVLTDCPHREKLGWLEVSHLLSASILYNYDGARFYQKICRDMRESQLDNGMVPDIAPEFTVFSGGFRDSPEWGSASVVNPWILWETYGDRRALSENYETMKRYTDYLASKATNHIIAFGLGDWCDVGPKGPGPSQLTSLGVTSTAMLFQNLNILEKTARLLGKIEDAAQFARHAALVREAFQKSFFRSAEFYYDRNSQAANAIALNLGLAEPGHRPAIAQNLARNIRANQNRVTAGDVGFVYLVRALAENDYNEVLFDLVTQTNGPGYIYQLNKGATALVETWDANPATSQNHCMLGHTEEWFYHGLAGIRPDPINPGFKRFYIAPQVVGDLTMVKAKYESMHGPIESDWKKDGNRFTLKVTIPINTQATVILPTGSDSSVRENGKKLSDVQGIITQRQEPGRLALIVGSGTYTFQCDMETN